MLFPQRAQTICRFRNVEGPHVLIISQVGNTGLNLDFVNIMIVIISLPFAFDLVVLMVLKDTLWSTQEYEQLMGRIHRYPQLKHVIVYHLVVCNTTDVFLNCISEDKAMIHQAFVNSSAECREFITKLM